MNPRFDIHRFGKLLRHDLQRCHPRYGNVGNTIIGGMLFPTLMVLVQFLMDREMYAGYTFALYRLLLAFGYPLGVAALQPFQLYPQVGKKGKGIYFALLPASKSEKYWSMLLMSLVVVPAITILGALAIDTLLALFHFGPWQQFFWQFVVKYPINPWIVANFAVAVTLAVAVSVWVNAIRSKWAQVLGFVAYMLWMVLGVAGLVVTLRSGEKLNERGIHFDSILGVAFAIQCLVLLAAIFLGRRQMDRITY